ncbi:hypothetical protein [Streptomyces decoyicus]|uniref:hypothetical protein n=1 Tax=Streptomyces decoyicus TaxID=249567 RepID=UPI0038700FF2
MRFVVKSLIVLTLAPLFAVLSLLLIALGVVCGLFFLALCPLYAVISVIYCKGKLDVWFSESLNGYADGCSGAFLYGFVNSGELFRALWKFMLS